MTDAGNYVLLVLQVSCGIHKNEYSPKGSNNQSPLFYNSVETPDSCMPSLYFILFISVYLFTVYLKTLPVMQAMRRRQAEPEMWKKGRTRALWHLHRYLYSTRRQTTNSPWTDGLWARSESGNPEKGVSTNHVSWIFCFKFQNKFFFASGQTVQRIGPESATNLNSHWKNG
jgi:hypothetical protein